VPLSPARLASNILLAFCWAHVRRDFLDAGRAFPELQAWALEWKERIGMLYHLNRLRLEQWDPELGLTEQSACFQQHHAALQAQLQQMHKEATRLLAPEHDAGAHREGAAPAPGAGLSKSARTRQHKVLASLLEHWSGLSVFVEHPEVPMDNNRAENTIRTPVNGRKNYYGSGSLWSAHLAATLFAILQTLVMWGINPRHWLTCYLSACAENGASPPRDIDAFLPWAMDETRRAALSRPYPCRAPPAEPPPIRDSA
jgi:transposase